MHIIDTPFNLLRNNMRRGSFITDDVLNVFLAIYSGLIVNV